MAVNLTIVPQGPFSLEEAANFGFGQRLDARWDGVMRLAFCVDGYRGHAGAVLTQDAQGVHAEVTTDQDPSLVQRQIERVLSLDYDATGFIEVGRRDPVMARLQAAAPGLRPPLFYSPYEAAAWSVISARRPARQMAEVRRKLSESYGATFELAGQRMAAFPTPERLVDIDAVDGLTAEKVSRLHAVAQAATDGRLDVSHIHELGADAARAELQQLPGIGPFYSSLIVVRASGLADVPVDEPKAMELAGHLYGLAGPPSSAEFEVMAEAWKPFRTWAVVLMRAAGGRVLEAAEHP